MLLILNDDRRKTPEPREFRAMTEQEIRALRYGEHPRVILNNGRVGTAKVNGAVRTWKRDPQRFEIPLKWGLYEHATFNREEALRRLVVEVKS